MAPVAHRIELLTDLFLGAAFADKRFEERERGYVAALVMDLLCSEELPAPVQMRIECFRPERFDLHAAAQDFLADPPMSRRRVLELVAYVTLADGQQSVDEDRYLRELGKALEMPPDDYRDLTLDPDSVRESFIDLARVPLPG